MISVWHRFRNFEWKGWWDFPICLKENLWFLGALIINLFFLESSYKKVGGPRLFSTKSWSVFFGGWVRRRQKKRKSGDDSDGSSVTNQQIICFSIFFPPNHGIRFTQSWDSSHPIMGFVSPNHGIRLTQSDEHDGTNSSKTKHHGSTSKKNQSGDRQGCTPIPTYP